MTGRWYVARTKSRAEQAAAFDLERAGLETFLPSVPIVDPKMGADDAPLFPGYLFLRCALERDWWAIRGSPHVWGLVRFEHEIPALPDDVIDDLRRRVDDINEMGGLWTRFKPGDTVHVRSGGTDTLASVLDEPKSPNARVKVLLWFMGGLVPAQVPFASLRRVSSGDSLDGFSRGRRRRTRGSGRWIAGLRPQQVPAAARS